MNGKKGVNARETIIDLLFYIFGCIAFAASMRMFVAPNQIAPGGISGLAVVLNYLVPALKIGTWTMLMNIPLLWLGLRFLGWNFTIKTMFCVLLSSLLTDYGMNFLPEYMGDELLASLFAGLLMGIGLAAVFMRGSTTGGTDILSRLLQIKYPHIPLGSLLFIIDAVVICISVFVFGRMETALYSLVAVFVTTKAVDSIMYGAEKGTLVHIVSAHSEQIAQTVMAEMGRGCTMLKAVGAYSRKDVEVVLVAIRRQQYYTLKKIVHEADPNAFIIVTESTEVLGEGFKPIGGK